MTDITELAQREKFEAWVMTQICISKSTLEGMRTADGYRNTTLSGTDYNRMWNCWKAAGAELVEALEKAQAQSSKWLEAYHKAVSIGARYEERIAELESRTVKLPDDAEHDIMAPVAAYLSENFKWDGSAARWDGCKEYDVLADRVKYAIRMVIRRAAGIKVEAE
ncbi:TPA: hypothetical protein ACQZJX_000767 [Klebsiella pneumoniae]